MTKNRVRSASPWRLAAMLVLVAALAATSWSRSDTAAQTTLPTTADAAPASSVVFLTFDLDREGAQWQQTEALLARVGVPDALDLWQDSILDEGAAMGDFTAADLDALFGGEMSVVVLPSAVERVAAMHMQMMAHDQTVMAADEMATPMAGAMDEQHGIVAILDPGDLDAAWDYARRQFTDLAAQRDTAVEETSAGDVEMLWIPPADDAMHQGMDHGDMDDWMDGYGMHDRSGIAAARAGEFIVAGKSQADVAEVVAVVSGDTESLSTAAEWQAVTAGLPAEALSHTYVNGQGIIDALGPMMASQLQVFMPEVPIEAWGGQSGFAVSADEPGFRFDTVTVAGPDADLTAMIPDNDPAVAAAAERAPVDTFIFQAGRLAESAFAGAPFSLAQAVNAGANAGADDEDEMMPFPTAEEMEQEIATATATLGFDPAANLFDLLGDEFIAFSSFPNLDFENFGLDAVAAVATSDPAELAETAQKTAAWIERSEPNTDVTVRQKGGDTVYVVSSAEMPIAPGVEFGVVGDQGVIAVGGGIDALFAEPAEPLAGDEQFQAVMALLPGEYYQVAYADIRPAVQPLVNLIEMMGQLGATSDEGTPVSAGSLENIRAFGAVSYNDGETSGASAILYIADESASTP